jgi:hypothetical protein
MTLSTIWIPLLPASRATDNHDGGSNRRPSDTAALDERAGALVDAVRAACGRVLTPAEERAVGVLTKALKTLLGEEVEEPQDDEEN